MADLTPKQRQHLKGLAHHLDPVVHIGKDGISENVKRQIDSALERHELIKVKLAESAPLDRDAAAAALPGEVGAFLVQNIGKVFVLYRPHPERPRIELPWPMEEEEEDLEESRVPKPRAAGSLLGSVRARGAAQSTTSRALTPPPRPVFGPADERQTPPPKPTQKPKGHAKAKRTARRSTGRRGRGRPR